MKYAILMVLALCEIDQTALGLVLLPFAAPYFSMSEWQLLCEKLASQSAAILFSLLFLYGLSSGLRFSVFYAKKT